MPSFSLGSRTIPTGADIVRYTQWPAPVETRLSRISVFHALEVGLHSSEEALLDNINGKTRYEIRRAAADYADRATLWSDIGVLWRTVVRLAAQR